MIAATDYWSDDGDSLVPERGPPSNKTYDALIDAIDSYFQKWPLDIDKLQPYRLPDGSPFVEKTFAFRSKAQFIQLQEKRLSTAAVSICSESGIILTCEWY